MGRLKGVFGHSFSPVCHNDAFLTIAQKRPPVKGFLKISLTETVCIKFCTFLCRDQFNSRPLRDLARNPNAAPCLHPDSCLTLLLSYHPRRLRLPGHHRRHPHLRILHPDPRHQDLQRPDPPHQHRYSRSHPYQDHPLPQLLFP